MATAKRGDDAEPTLLGASSVDSTTPLRARVDPVTGYVLVAILPIKDFTTTNPKARIDDNAVAVLKGVTNNAAQTVRPILSDPNNVGRVLIQTT